MELETLIASRPASRGSLRAWYERVLSVAEEHGITALELAGRLRCSRETIYSWRRRLRLEADSAGSTASASGLVRVQVTPSPATTEPSHLEVRLRAGRSILVSNTFDAETLATIVKVLEQC